MAALRGAEVAATELSAGEALILAREALYRETAGSKWKPTLIGDKVMPRLPEDDVKHPDKAGLLWPSIRSQLFRIDAVTHGGQRVEIGENEYASVDMMIGPEDPRPFVELASWLGQDRLPVARRLHPRGRRQDRHGVQGDRIVVPGDVPGEPRSSARLRVAAPDARAGQPHRGQAARVLRDLGADRREPETAPARVDARADGSRAGAIARRPGSPGIRSTG